MEDAGSTDAQHLCVLIHGLWGNPAHVQVMADALRAKHPKSELHILVAKSNSSNLTYDGIERGGERVCQEIEEEIEKLTKEGCEIKKLSLVGYSMGGLVGRYAAGLLYHRGVFEKIKPVNFATFASPHLGVRSPKRGILKKMWNAIGERTVSASGEQIFTVDNFRGTGKPLLEILAEPDSIFMKALALFERRTLYANIKNDQSAVYYTTYITATDPYVDLDKLKINTVKGYEDVILDPDTPYLLRESDDPFHDNSVYGSLIRRSKKLLEALPWIFALTLLLPIGVVAFFINAGIQTFRSKSRIALHESGKGGVKTDTYRIPLLVPEGIRDAITDAYENINSDGTDAEYMTSKPSASSSSVDSTSKLTSTSTPNGKTNGHTTEKPSLALKSPTNSFPVLALSPAQFRMIDSLDAVGWRKYPVWIHKVRHSHAAIIVRMQRKGFTEGRVVLRHWLDGEFII